MTERNKSISAQSRRNSFIYAGRGLQQVLRLEPNAKLHMLASLAAIILGVVRHINTIQWVAIIFAIGLVWITETINTAIERLADFSCEHKFHPEIKVIKDIAAGAVLIAAVVSLAIGIIIFCF
jgi:diacylglycerol kinase